jgi:hypothetical protein
VPRTCPISHIPGHQTADGSGVATPAGAPPAAIASEDLDFSDMKKKKKTTSKKKAMEDFEKELGESKSKDAAEGADEVEIDDGEHLYDIDEAELGDDPFARPEVLTSVDSGTEPWLTSDRDYTYQEVGRPRFNSRLMILTNPIHVAPHTVLHLPSRLQSFPSYVHRKAVHHRSTSNPPRRCPPLHLRERRRYLQAYAQISRTRHFIPLC